MSGPRYSQAGVQALKHGVAAFRAGDRIVPARPAEGEATDLDRLYSTLNLQGVWVLIDEVAGAVCPWCGDPWESEPSCEHAEAIYEHDARVMAYALEQAAAAMPDVEGSKWARGWLRERAARLRGGA